VSASAAPDPPWIGRRGSIGRDQPAGIAPAVPAPAVGAGAEDAVVGAADVAVVVDGAVDAVVEEVDGGVELDVEAGADEPGLDAVGAEVAEVTGGSVVVAVTVAGLDDGGASPDPEPPLPPSTE